MWRFGGGLPDLPQIEHKHARICTALVENLPRYLANLTARNPRIPGTSWRSLIGRAGLVVIKVVKNQCSASNARVLMCPVDGASGALESCVFSDKSVCVKV